MNMLSTNDPKSWLEACGYQNSLLIKVGGLADMHLAVTTKELITNSYDKGYQVFILDFTNCSGLDSTYMGTLICLWEEVEKKNFKMELYNVNNPCQKLLEMLGVASILQLNGDLEIPDLEYTCLTPTIDNAEVRLQLIERAHQRLVNLNPENQQRFGKFLDMLKEE